MVQRDALLCAVHAFDSTRCAYELQRGVGFAHTERAALQGERGHSGARYGQRFDGGDDFLGVDDYALRAGAAGDVVDRLHIVRAAARSLGAPHVVVSLCREVVGTVVGRGVLGVRLDVVVHVVAQHGYVALGSVPGQAHVVVLSILRGAGGVDVGGVGQIGVKLHGDGRSDAGAHV